MTVGFLTPLFLAAAAALAVPILVHLVRRQDRASAPFPSLMFIQRLPRRERRRRTLHHRPLLLLRCLALALLFLAFAQPFFELSTMPVSGAEGTRDRVVVLDRSYSMGYGDRWERAVQAARQAIEELGGRDRVALVLFDHETEVSGALTADHRSLISMLAVGRPAAGHTKLLGAIESAGRLLTDSTAEHREIVLISDFQRTGFEAGKQVAVPAGTRIIPRPIQGGNAANAALVAVNVVRRSRDAGDAVQLVARVLNAGTVTMDTIDVVLEVNDRERARDTLALKAGEAGEVTFDLVIDATTPSRVRVRTGSDALAADNVYQLVLTNGQAISVWLLQDPGARPAQALYLQRALDQGTEPTFHVDISTAAEIREDALDNTDVVVINDAPIPGGRVGEALQRFLHAGGGLLIVAADRLQGAWPNDKTGFVPGVLGPAVSRDEADPARILGAHLTHPVWAAFTDPDGGDLAGAQVYRYRALSDVASHDIIARYDNDAVAIAERRVGRGHVLVVTTTLDPYWNTLPMQAGYLPFVHAALKYLAGYVPIPHAFLVGDVVDLGRYAKGHVGHATAAAALARGAAARIRTPAGQQQQLAPGVGAVHVREPGFYEVHVSGSGARSLVFAANAPSEESRLEPLAIDTLLAAVTPASANQASVVNRETDTSQRQLWWFILLAGALLLGLESWVANRLLPGRTARTTT